MIAKFRFSNNIPSNKQLHIEHTTGKVNKFFMREVFVDSTSDICMTYMFMNVGGQDYDLSKVSNLTLYTNKGSVITISRNPSHGWDLNGAHCSDTELIDRLNELYVTENRKDG